jgi:hypothetical protein
MEYGFQQDYFASINSISSTLQPFHGIVSLINPYLAMGAFSYHMMASMLKIVE